MEFALFCEMPVPRIAPDGEFGVYQDTLAQAIVADEAGFHSFWTVEHHFLKGMSHCSNPEVLYGAIASRTKNIRIGYGVRLMAKPYNHPIRTAESVAVLDLLSNGRVELGMGRSATRIELEGFGVDPRESAAMMQEAIGHVLGCWLNDEYTFEGKYWSMPVSRRVQPKPRQRPHPPLWFAAGSPDSHYKIGTQGAGVLSLAFGGIEDIRGRMEAYRAGLKENKKPLGEYLNDRAACYAMMHCAPTRKEAYETAKESFEWYLDYAKARGVEASEWMATLPVVSAPERKEEVVQAQSGTAQVRITLESSFEALVESGGCIVGDPDDCLKAAQRYADAGVDLLFGLANPWDIPNDKVQTSLRLLGEHVLPKVRSDRDHQARREAIERMPA